MHLYSSFETWNNNLHDSQIATRMKQIPSRADPIGGDQKHQRKTSIKDKSTKINNQTRRPNNVAPGMKKSTHFSNLRYYHLQCTPNFIVSM